MQYKKESNARDGAGMLRAAGTKQQRSESKLKNPPGQVASWCALDLTTQYTIHSMNKEFSLWQYLLWSFQGKGGLQN